MPRLSNKERRERLKKLKNQKSKFASSKGGSQDPEKSVVKLSKLLPNVGDSIIVRVIPMKVIEEHYDSQVSPMAESFPPALIDYSQVWGNKKMHILRDIFLNEEGTLMRDPFLQHLWDRYSFFSKALNNPTDATTEADVELALKYLPLHNITAASKFSFNGQTAKWQENLKEDRADRLSKNKKEWAVLRPNEFVTKKSGFAFLQVEEDRSENGSSVVKEDVCRFLEVGSSVSNRIFEIFHPMYVSKQMLEAAEDEDERKDLEADLKEYKRQLEARFGKKYDEEAKKYVPKWKYEPNGKKAGNYYFSRSEEKGGFFDGNIHMGVNLVISKQSDTFYTVAIERDLTDDQDDNRPTFSNLVDSEGNVLDKYLLNENRISILPYFYEQDNADAILDVYNGAMDNFILPSEEAELEEAEDVPQVTELPEKPEVSIPEGVAEAMAGIPEDLEDDF